MNEARGASDFGATLCELVEIKSELRLAGRDARFERPPSMRKICGWTCNVTAGLCAEGGGRTHRVSLQTGHDTKRGGNGGEHGDEDLEDFAPDVCFCVFHFV